MLICNQGFGGLCKRGFCKVFFGSSISSSSVSLLFLRLRRYSRYDCVNLVCRKLELLLHILACLWREPSIMIISLGNHADNGIFGSLGAKIGFLHQPFLVVPTHQI